MKIKVVNHVIKTSLKHINPGEVFALNNELHIKTDEVIYQTSKDFVERNKVMCFPSGLIKAIVSNIEVLKVRAKLIVIT